MKCQSCHFISSNYRLACRPFNDHLQRSLQCIRGSTKSLSHSLAFTLSKNTHTLAYIIMNLQTTNSQILIGTQKNCTHTLIYKHTQVHTANTYYSILFQTSHFLFICNVQNKTTHRASFTWPANQKLNRTFVITIALYLSIMLHTFKTIPFHPCLYFCNHIWFNAQKYFIINQERGSIRKGRVRSGMDEG